MQYRDRREDCPVTTKEYPFHFYFTFSEGAFMKPNKELRDEVREFVAQYDGKIIRLFTDYNSFVEEHKAGYRIAVCFREEKDAMLFKLLFGGV
jgi:hypothetical protein